MQNLKLEIDVTPKTFEKIQALSRLTQVKPKDLTDQIGDLINRFLDEALIEATHDMLKTLGVNPGLIPSQTDTPILHASLEKESEDDVFLRVSEEETVGSLRDPEETKPRLEGKGVSGVAAQVAKQFEEEDEEDSDGPMIVMASADDEDLDEMEAEEGDPNDFGEGPSEEEFQSMDPELDEDEDMKLFLGDDEDMEIKGKNGEDVSFKDDFMNDIQEEFGDMEDFASAPSKAKVNKVSTIPKDVDDESLDVLPQDFGLNGVTEDDKSATSFFMAAMSGQQGDKSKRNGVKRKRILMPGDY